MTKNISKKAQWQAKISQCPKTALKLLNAILAESLKHHIVETSRARLANQIRRTLKTVDRLLAILKSFGLIKIISGKDDWAFNIYIPNPVLFDLAHLFKDKLSSLKQYIYESTNSFLVENVSPYIDNIISQFNCSSSSDFFKNLVAGFIFTLDAKPLDGTRVRSFFYSSLLKYLKPHPTCFKWAPSSMEEELAVKKLTEEADSLADYVEPTTLDEIKNLLTIPELKQWIEQY